MNISLKVTLTPVSPEGSTPGVGARPGDAGPSGASGRESGAGKAAGGPKAGSGKGGAKGPNSASANSPAAGPKPGGAGGRPDDPPKHPDGQKQGAGDQPKPEAKEPPPCECVCSCEPDYRVTTGPLTLTPLGLAAAVTLQPPLIPMIQPSSLPGGGGLTQIAAPAGALPVPHTAAGPRSSPATGGAAAVGGVVNVPVNDQQGAVAQNLMGGFGLGSVQSADPPLAGFSLVGTGSSASSNASQVARGEVTKAGLARATLASQGDSGLALGRDLTGGAGLEVGGVPSREGGGVAQSPASSGYRGIYRPGGGGDQATRGTGPGGSGDGGGRQPDGGGGPGDGGGAGSGGGSGGGDGSGGGGGGEPGGGGGSGGGGGRGGPSPSGGPLGAGPNFSPLSDLPGGKSKGDKPLGGDLLRPPMGYVPSPPYRPQPPPKSPSLHPAGSLGGDLWKTAVASGAVPHVGEFVPGAMAPTVWQPPRAAPRELSPFGTGGSFDRESALVTPSWRIGMSGALQQSGKEVRFPPDNQPTQPVSHMSVTGLDAKGAASGKQLSEVDPLSGGSQADGGLGGIGELGRSPADFFATKGGGATALAEIVPRPTVAPPSNGLVEQTYDAGGRPLVASVSALAVLGASRAGISAPSTAGGSSDAIVAASSARLPAGVAAAPATQLTPRASREVTEETRAAAPDSMATPEAPPSFPTTPKTPGGQHLGSSADPALEMRLGQAAGYGTAGAPQRGKGGGGGVSSVVAGVRADQERLQRANSQAQRDWDAADARAGVAGARVNRAEQALGSARARHDDSAAAAATSDLASAKSDRNAAVLERQANGLFLQGANARERERSGREWRAIESLQRQNPTDGFKRYIEERMRQDRDQVRTSRQAGSALASQMRQSDKQLASWKTRVPADQYKARADAAGASQREQIGSRLSELQQLDAKMQKLDAERANLSPEEKKQLADLTKDAKRREHEAQGLVSREIALKASQEKRDEDAKARQDRDDRRRYGHLSEADAAKRRTTNERNQALNSLRTAEAKASNRGAKGALAASALKDAASLVKRGGMSAADGAAIAKSPNPAQALKDWNAANAPRGGGYMKPPLAPPPPDDTTPPPPPPPGSEEKKPEGSPDSATAVAPEGSSATATGDATAGGQSKEPPQVPVDPCAPCKCEPKCPEGSKCVCAYSPSPVDDSHGGGDTPTGGATGTGGSGDDNRRYAEPRNPCPAGVVCEVEGKPRPNPCPEDAPCGDGEEKAKGPGRTPKSAPTSPCFKLPSLIVVLGVDGEPSPDALKKLLQEPDSPAFGAHARAGYYGRLGCKPPRILYVKDLLALLCWLHNPTGEVPKEGFLNVEMFDHGNSRGPIEAHGFHTDKTYKETDHFKLLGLALATRMSSTPGSVGYVALTWCGSGMSRIDTSGSDQDRNARPAGVIAGTSGHVTFGSSGDFFHGSVDPGSSDREPGSSWFDESAPSSGAHWMRFEPVVERDDADFTTDNDTMRNTFNKGENGQPIRREGAEVTLPYSREDFGLKIERDPKTGLPIFPLNTADPSLDPHMKPKNDPKTKSPSSEDAHRLSDQAEALGSLPSRRPPAPTLEDELELPGGVKPLHDLLAQILRNCPNK